MKKIKIILIIVAALIVLWITFFIVDYNRVSNDKTPIFSIMNPKGVYEDGGTVEYFGLGYKIIDFNVLNGYDEIKIGTWFMKYADFEDEFYKKDYEEEYKYVKLEDLPKEYSLKQAIKDGCFIITRNKLYNIDVLNDFIANTEKNSKNRKEDTIRIVQYTTEGDPIIIDVTYNIEGNDPYCDCIESSNYIVKVDRTRDKFSAKEDRIITTDEDFPGSIYGIIKFEKEDIVEIRLALYAEICYISPDVKIYEDYLICSYNKNLINEGESSFYATVIDSNTNFIIVTPYENEQEIKSADKIMIKLGENNDAIYQVGTNVKITYNGIILESYPAQIKASKIEVKSADSFELVYYYKIPDANEKIHTIIDKSETDKYDYNIYSYYGTALIKIDGKHYDLRDALLNNKITMNEIIVKANKDISNPIMYKDGGSVEYNYQNYKIIKMHTIEGNRDVYIGPTNMNINDIDK